MSFVIGKVLPKHYKMTKATCNFIWSWRKNCCSCLVSSSTYLQTKLFAIYWMASALQIIKSSLINKILIRSHISNAYKRELLMILPISTQLTALPVEVVHEIDPAFLHFHLHISVISISLVLHSWSCV